MYNLKAFRERVRELYTRARPGNGKKRATQKDLARAIGLNQTELSNRFNATKGAHLSERDIKAIVLALVDWGVIDSQAQVDELLALLDCPTFSAAERASSRLRKLATLEFGLQSSHPAATKTNLPTALSSFVGRKHELATLTQLLADNRLLTITGTGGSGKTRLALQLGREVANRFADGVFVVDLATMPNPILLPQLVAKELDISELSGQQPCLLLIEELKTRELLIILDNCERVAPTVAELAHHLLSTCPNLRLIVTSREKLGAEGEVNFQLLPMSLPPAATKTSIRSLTKYEAVRLFIERSSAAMPTFHLTQANAQDVREICERLEGIPLALELAAAWMNVLDAAEICARLSDRLRLLVSGGRSVVARHQTIKASLDWSYNLLSATEQRLLARLAVCSGTFTLEAAEGICADEILPQDNIFALLGQLVDKSLVFKSADDSTLRFTMLEIIREYAYLRLEESGEQQELHRRLAYFYLGIAEQASAALSGPGQAEWLATLSHEHNNLRAALSWAERGGEADLLLGYVSNLWRFWYIHGHLSEGRHWIQAALDQGTGRDAILRASVLYGAGNLAWSQGDYAAAKRSLEDCLSIYRASGDLPGCSLALGSLGSVAASQGDYLAANAYYTEGLSIKMQLNDQQGIAAALNNLGSVTTMQGDYGLAQGLFEESITRFEQIANERGIATALNNLGDVFARQGDPSKARTLHEQSLAIRLRLGDRYGIAAVLHSLGQSAYLEGDYPTAEHIHIEALSLRQELNDRYGITCSLDAFACLALQRQQVVRAVRLFAAAERLRNTLGAYLPPPEREEREGSLAVARSNLDSITFATIWGEGERFDFSQASSYALAATDHSCLCKSRLRPLSPP